MVKFVRLDKINDETKYYSIWEQLESLALEAGICCEGTVPFLGLWDGRELVGAVWVEDVKEGGYWNVAVTEGQQSKGYGRKLVRELHAQAKKLKYEFLQCEPINPKTKEILKDYDYEPYNAGSGHMVQRLYINS